MGGPEMAPHTPQAPQHSGRPGEAVAPLDTLTGPSPSPGPGRRARSRSDGDARRRAPRPSRRRGARPRRLLAAAREAFGDDLVSVVLFGSAAEGALRATSDVNLIVILRAFDRARADAVRDAARVAHAAAGLRAMFLLREEVEQAAAAFAQKFADVRRRHRVLWGEDPFARLAVPRAALAARTNQVLLNLALRLRAQYVRSEERRVGKECRSRWS